MSRSSKRNQPTSSNSICNVEDEEHEVQPSSKKSRAGRPSTSIHDYFEYDSAKKKTSCKQEKCSWSVNGKDPTNLKYHLRTKHLPVFKTFTDKEEALEKERAEKEKKKNSASTSSNQLTLEQVC